MPTLGPKAVDCLRYAALPIGSPARQQVLVELERTYSARAVGKKLDELTDRGYVEALKRGAACGGLTEKGAAVLLEVDGPEAMAARARLADEWEANEFSVGSRLRRVADRLRRQSQGDT